WVRTNPRARQAKSKARIARFEELSSYEHQKRNETQEIFIPVAERLGDSVIEFKSVSKGYGDRELIDDLSIQIPAGAIVGVIGPNGAGKTTLFRMITDKEKPDRGEIVVGSTVRLAVVDQTRESLPNDRWFLDRIATHILSAEDDSKWMFFEGNYQDYEADKKKRLGEDGARPHRPRYKPLMH